MSTHLLSRTPISDLDLYLLCNLEVYTLRVYALRVYSLGLPISDLDLYLLYALRVSTLGVYILGVHSTYSVFWGSTIWGSTLSWPIDFGSGTVPTLCSGSLHSGGLLSRATDFGSGSVLTLCSEGLNSGSYALGVYSLGLPISSLELNIYRRPFKPNK